MNSYVVYEASNRDALIKNSMAQVFGWMSCALLITAAAAFFTANSVAMVAYIIQNPIAIFGLIIVQLGLVIALSSFVNRLTYRAAAVLFLCYALLTGITLASIFLIYTTASIVATFVISAGMFGAMALYGAYTKSDLTSIGTIGRMVLVGLILALLVNLFLKSSLVDFVTAIVGVILFAGLTAFDMQRIKTLMINLIHDRESMSKVTIIAALTLYLDFINLFLSMLRIIGSARNRE